MNWIKAAPVFFVYMLSQPKITLFRKQTHCLGGKYVKCIYSLFLGLGADECNNRKVSDPSSCCRYASCTQSSATGAADWHHTWGFEVQPSAPLLSGLPWRGRQSAAGSWGAYGHCHAGHTVQLSSQVHIYYSCFSYRTLIIYGTSSFTFQLLVVFAKLMLSLSLGTSWIPPWTAPNTFWTTWCLYWERQIQNYMISWSGTDWHTTDTGFGFAGVAAVPLNNCRTFLTHPVVDNMLLWAKSLRCFWLEVM